MSAELPALETLRVMIVDDEPAGRQLLQSLLAREPGIEIVGVCRHGDEALTVLGACPVDLLFLDIQMPGKNGFEVLRALAEPPPVVFVTAHEQFAREAFEVEAWDYLLKPFDEERLGETLNRVRRRLGAAAGSYADAGSRAAEGPLERLAIPHGRGRVMVRMERVLAIEAESNYARFHLPERSHLARISLAALERRLDPARFVRVHRSWIVNIDHLERQEPAGHGDLRLTLSGGLQVGLSRRYRGRLEALVEPMS